MPFYFGAPYAPAEIWRHLENYTPTFYQNTVAKGVNVWVNIVNYVGRGVLISISNRLNLARDYRMAIDGGAFQTFTMGAELGLSFFIGFGTSIQVQHNRTVASGVSSLCVVLQE